MKIDGLTNFLSNSQTISELNLREGQIIMGKIINLTMDDAMMEIAGRPLQAKVEGNPPVANGTVAIFQVGKDETGRILLKFIASPVETVPVDNGGEIPQETNPENDIGTAVLKNIKIVLQKEGVPPTPENIETIWQNLQNFQAKYQQPLNPQILAFILARKWPITPGTILTSMVSQNQEARDLLWNILQKSLPEKVLAEFIAKYVLAPQAGSETLTGKMIAFSDQNSLQELFGKLFKLNNAGSLEENQEQSAGAGQSEIETTGKLGRTEQQKITAVLEQHLSLAKAVPDHESAAKPSYTIPFLTGDSKNGFRELVVKWREEPPQSKNGNSGQLLFITIPTENMGEINLSLRITDINTGINLKVNSHDIRQYLLNHIAELKEAVGRPSTAVAVGLKEHEPGSLIDMGIDLWM